jgi:hypothetical protein
VKQGFFPAIPRRAVRPSLELTVDPIQGEGAGAEDRDLLGRVHALEASDLAGRHGELQATSKRVDEQLSSGADAVHDDRPLGVFQVVPDNDFSLCEHGHSLPFQHRPLPRPSWHWIYDAQIL